MKILPDEVSSEGKTPRKRVASLGSVFDRASLKKCNTDSAGSPSGFHKVRIKHNFASYVLVLLTLLFNRNDLRKRVFNVEKTDALNESRI